jgi:hypothetical protein
MARIRHWHRAASVGVLLAALALPALAQRNFPVRQSSFPEPVLTPQDDPVKQARLDYILHCSGCHFLHGEGAQAAGIPRVRDQLGYFLTLPEGRAYLMQVPGLLSAGLSDERAAGVVNWMVEYFSGPSRPAAFQPYTADEALRYRLEKPADIIGARNRIAAELIAAGLPFR